MDVDPAYRAIVRCRRCGTIRHVPMAAEPYRHWFCHRTEGGAWCLTFNVIDPTAWSESGTGNSAPRS